MRAALPQDCAAVRVEGEYQLPPQQRVLLKALDRPGTLQRRNLVVDDAPVLESEQ